MCGPGELDFTHKHLQRPRWLSDGKLPAASAGPTVLSKIEGTGAPHQRPRAPSCRDAVGGSSVVRREAATATCQTLTKAPRHRTLTRSLRSTGPPGRGVWTHELRDPRDSSHHPAEHGGGEGADEPTNGRELAYMHMTCTTCLLYTSPSPRDS